MIWKLFRPRPILKITLPNHPEEEVFNRIKKSVGSDYIVILTSDQNLTDIKVEILNEKNEKDENKHKQFNLQG